MYMPGKYVWELLLEPWMVWRDSGFLWNRVPVQIWDLQLGR